VNVTGPITYNGPIFGKGRLPPKWFLPSATHHRALGSALRAPTPEIAGSWDLLNRVGGVGNQYRTSRCFSFATKKAIGLYQFGQSGNAFEFSSDWIYKCVLSEIRRLELGGSPTLAELLANTLQDLGSEPSAVAACKELGFALEVDYPTGSTFNPQELTMGGELIAKAWRPLALGLASIIARPGPELSQAVNVALSPFADGKRGQCIVLSIAANSNAFMSADGSQILKSTDFDGANYDHAVALGGFARTPVTPESPTGKKYLLYNSWDLTQWGQLCTVPELTPDGTPTGNEMPFPGCVWITERAMWGAADHAFYSEKVAS